MYREREVLRERANAIENNSRTVRLSHYRMQIVHKLGECVGRHRQAGRRGNVLLRSPLK